MVLKPPWPLYLDIHGNQYTVENIENNTVDKAIKLFFVC